MLIPGVGAQGGDLASAVSSGTDADGEGILINASRSILYAGGGADFDGDARSVASDLRNEINQYRNPVTV